MNCEHIENLLPRYADGDLSRVEMGAVDSHVRECGACANSLAAYVSLEQALQSRRSEMPSAGALSRGVNRRLGLRRDRVIVGALTGLPGILSGSFIMVGIILLVFRNQLGTLIGRFESALGQASPQATGGLGAFIEKIGYGIAQLGGMDEWTLITLYVGIAALIMLSGSLMVLRFVRE